MNKAASVKLSLRKLFIATLALGPLAILPSPLWALPTSSSYTVTNGAVTLGTSPGSASFTASDRSVLVWGSGNFFINSGETWNFNLPSTTASVLNKIGYQTNGALGTADNAAILGTLFSNGKVFILANGNITIGTGASIDTQGLVLSTLQEASDFTYTTTGNLALNGATTGNIAINSLNVAGSLTTFSGAVVSGTGLLGAATDGTVSATVATIGVGGLIASLTSTGGGLFYSTAPGVTISGGSGAGATATTTLAGNGSVTNNGIVPNAGGAGYVVGDTVTVAIAANPNLASVTANQIGGGSVTGDFAMNTVTSGAGIKLATGANLSVSGNLTANTNLGPITQGFAVADGNLSTFNTAGAAAITLGNTSNTLKNVSFNTTGASSVTVTNNGNITLAASAIGQDLTVDTTAATSGGNITTSGAVVVGGNATYKAAANKSLSIGNSSSVGNTLIVTTTNASATFNGVGNITLGNATVAVTAGSGNAASISVTTNGTLTLGNTVSAQGNNTAGTSVGGAISLTGGSIIQNAAADVFTGNTALGNGGVTFNATSGALTLNGNIVNSNNASTPVTLKAAGGTITEASTSNITTANTTGTLAVSDVAGTVSLNGANKLAAGSIVQMTAGTATINNTGTAGSLTIGTTNVTSTYTVNNAAANNGVILGTGVGTSAQNIVVGGNLVVSALGTGTITDGAYTAFNVFGQLNLTTGAGGVNLNAARTNNSLAPLVQFGQVAITAAGPVSIAETSTLNLGNITVTGAGLNAYSVSGNIINSGNITTGAASLFQVGSTGTITLNGTNSFTGAVTFNGGTDGLLNVNSGVTFALGSSAPGNMTVTSTSGSPVILAAGGGGAGNLTVNSGDTIAVNGAVNVGNLTLNATNSSGSATSISETGTLTVANNATIGAASGNVLLGNATAIANDFNSLIVNQAANSGSFQATDINNLTISGSSGGLVAVVAGANVPGTSVANTWNLTLGNLTASNVFATASSAGGGNSGTITQVAGSVLHAENSLDLLTTNGNIVVANAGNSAGRVQINTGGTASSTVLLPLPAAVAGSSSSSNVTVTYAEDATVKLGNLALQGNATITSRTGGIIEDTTTNDSIGTNGTLTLNAPNGSISIGNTTHTTGTTVGNVVTFVASAPSGAVTLNSSAGNLTLGAINANSLAINASGNVAQSAPLTVFGSFNVTSSQNITLTNNSNNFGPILLNATAANKNITINENGTMNLRTIAMAGNGNGTFTATSVTADIISTGFGGVRPGGTTAFPGTGVVTLAAAKGNITVGDATSDFPTSGGVVFNGNNVSLTVLGNATLTLGANTTSSVANNLTVTSAIGSMANGGNISVTGNASFTSGNGNISLNQSGDQFGTLKFSGNQVSIIQGGDMKILTGSSAIGAASLASTGNISIVNVGGVVSFGNTVSMVASGNITLPKLIQAANTLTVNAAGTKDLSSLSVTGDLGGKSPINLGTGAYLAPQN